MRDGSVAVGCNVENAAYPTTICAERVALTSAVAQGKRDFVAIAVATANGGTPCGTCRQVMAELGPEMVVYISERCRQLFGDGCAQPAAPRSAPGGWPRVWP